MWTRKELKSRARALLSKHYWPAVLISLLAGILSSQISLNFSSYKDIYSMSDAATIDTTTALATDYSESIINMSNITIILAALGVGVGALVLVAAIINLFVINPLNVGFTRWFIVARTEDHVDASEVIYPFQSGYLNVVKIEFLRILYTALWTLCFIIPGIIKTYEYRMVPYLLAENPNMSSDEAFARSRELMNGHKWNAFVLDISFFGWALIGAFTFNIFNVFFTLPYQQFTNMELYISLCCKGNNTTNNFNQYDDAWGSY